MISSNLSCKLRGDDSQGMVCHATFEKKFGFRRVRPEMTASSLASSKSA